MLKNILFPLLAATCFISCKQYNTTIEGEIRETGKQKVYLEQVNVDRTLTVDSTRMDKKGKFNFGINVTEPTFYNLRIGNERLTLLAEADKKITFTGTLEGLGNNYWVEGSDASLWIKLLNFQLNSTRKALDSLKKVYETLPKTAEGVIRRQAVIAEWDSVFLKQNRFSNNFILKHAVSPVSYYALYQKIDEQTFVLTPENDLQAYKIVLSSLMALFPESQYTKAISNHYEQIKKDIQTIRMQELIANAENSLPEIELPDATGKSISLSSLRGKYIILDFTVLGTPESASHIRELKEIYNKYRNKGVEVYQVCLDQNKLLWEEYVRHYDIKWKCVRDPEALQSKVALRWNIQTLPANYIINPKYDIAGKNLYGRRLDDRLQDIIK